MKLTARGGRGGYFILFFLFYLVTHTRQIKFKVKGKKAM